MGNFSLNSLFYTSIITLVSYIISHCHAAVVSSGAITTPVEEALEDHKLYAIQNANDNTYLKAINNGEICDKRGDVITSRYLDQHSTAYRWMHKILTSARVHLDVDSHDFKINEVTMQATPPNCYSAFAEYELVEVHPGTYRIKSFHSKKCLTGNGMGQRISFEVCQSVWRNHRSQFWNFIDLDKEKLYEEERK